MYAYLYVNKLAMILRYSWRTQSGTKESTNRVWARHRKLGTAMAVGAPVGVEFGPVIVGDAVIEVVECVDVMTALFATS